MALGRGGNSAEGLFDVGGRLLALRQLHGLSQRELARRAGMTNANLSLIEQGKVSPALHTLEKILQAVPITLTEFFGCSPLLLSPILKKETLSRTVLDEVETIGWTASLLEGQSLYHGQLCLAPGAETQVPMYKNAQYVLGLVHVGELQLLLDEIEHELNMGDGFQFSGRRSHKLVNTSGYDVLISLSVFQLFST